MNIVLVDDDRIYLDELCDTVKRMCERNHINATISATDKPLSLLEKNIYNHYDVILLDIDMPGISGIELASEINKLKGMSERPYIIFVSGRDGLVFQALREQPFSFVRKSDINDLLPCLKKINSRLSVENTYGIKSGRTVEKVLVREIVYLEKSGNYVVFHSTEDDSIITVDENGLVKGIAPGTGTVTVSCGSVSTDVEIVVTSSGNLLLGDADLSGEVDIADATTIQRHDAHFITLIGTALQLADVDKDDDVTIIDATWIQRWELDMKAPEGIGKPI